jgi:peroxiredoxin (alkyl hydroperoxide reductase subunit C)
MDEVIGRMPLIETRRQVSRQKTTQGEINFPEDFEGTGLSFFSPRFHPCVHNRVHDLCLHQEDLQSGIVNCLGFLLTVLCSIAWLRPSRKNKIQGIKDIEVTFPVIEDLKMDISRAFGMLQPGASSTQAVRAVFIIDPKSIVRAILYYPLSNGRNMDEVMRLLIAMQTSDEYGIATPANWQPGDDVIVPPPGSCGVAKSGQRSLIRYVLCLDWFMCLKKFPRGE